MLDEAITKTDSLGRLPPSASPAQTPFAPLEDLRSVQRRVSSWAIRSRVIGRSSVACRSNSEM